MIPEHGPGPGSGAAQHRGTTTSTTTTTTNIKAAGAVDREYANLSFIRRPFAVLS